MTQPADPSGRYSAMPAEPSPRPVAWLQFVLPALFVVFTSGGALVKLSSVEGDLDRLEQRLEDHANLGGHREGMTRLEQLEQDRADGRARDEVEGRLLAGKLDAIQITLADLCAAQRPNPCKR